VELEGVKGVLAGRGAIRAKLAVLTTALPVPAVFGCRSYALAAVCVSLIMTAVPVQSDTALEIIYEYDDLNRLTTASYGGGQQVISYTYDDAGNMLSRTVTVAEQDAPALAITYAGPLQLAAPQLLLTGTASDAGGGDSGIDSVTINGAPADGGSAAGSATANWSLEVGPGLVVGTNTFTVVATDGSPWANQATDSLAVVYLPGITDGTGNGLPDSWEAFYGVTDPGADDDLDGILNGDEFKAGTSPQNGSDRPEGANGINYVLLRDHFDDDQYQDRWFFTSMALDTSFTVSEAGTQLGAQVAQPAVGCTGYTLESFSTVDAADLVYRAELELPGAGRATLGLRRDLEADNRIEVIFDNDAGEPYLTVRSVDTGVVTDTQPVVGGAFQGEPVTLRITKAGEQYDVYVNAVNFASFTHSGLGDSLLRPYIATESCDDSDGGVDAQLDLVELLVDSDADGRADTDEDANANGAFEANESDPLVADSDGDLVLDGHDNCVLSSNASQFDSDGDGYGNLCDPDFNNNGIIDSQDGAILRLRFGQPGFPDQDLNGNGIVDSQDGAILRLQFGQPVGPSGLDP